jgi:hypothetical protein
MLKKLIILLAMCSISLAYASASEEVEVAEELLTVMDTEKQMLGGFEAMLPIVNQVASNLALDAIETEELKSIYRDWFENDIDRSKMRREIAELYASKFTIAEMKEIIAFYGTEIGKKFIQISPELAKAGAQIGMREAQDKQALLVEKVTPFIEKHSLEAFEND